MRKFRFLKWTIMIVKDDVENDDDFILKNQHLLNVPLADKKQAILEFWQSHIEDYILKDIHILMDIPVVNGLGGCTLPAAMTILSAMEMFGTLIQLNPQDLGSKYSTEFMGAFCGIPEAEQKMLIRHYRNKLMHVFFPKVTKKSLFGATKDKPSDSSLFKQKQNVTDLRVLNLYEKFKYGVDALYQRIVANDEKIINAIYVKMHEYKGKPLSSTTTTQTTVWYIKL